MQQFTVLEIGNLKSGEVWLLGRREGDPMLLLGFDCVPDLPPMRVSEEVWKTTSPDALYESWREVMRKRVRSLNLPDGALRMAPLAEPVA